MTKQEFMSKLSDELNRRGVADADDILEEYEQHFTFKLSDGCTEEEIAARLGDPARLAAQFVESGEAKKSGGAGLVVAGVCLADLFGGMVYMLMAAFALVLGAAAIAFAAVGLCLIAGLDMGGLIPGMPGAGALIVGLALMALSGLTACGCVWYVAFLKQMARAAARMQANALAAAHGRAALPNLPCAPHFSVRTSRRLRRTARVCLMLFAVLFVMGYIVLAVSAGSVQFWHAWGWFGYQG